MVWCELREGSGSVSRALENSGGMMDPWKRKVCLLCVGEFGRGFGWLVGYVRPSCPGSLAVGLVTVLMDSYLSIVT